MTFQDFLISGIAFSVMTTLLICALHYKEYLSNKLLLAQTHQAMAQLAMRLQQQEIILGKIGNAFNEFTDLVGNVVDKLEDGPPMMSGRVMFRTLDGKYSSNNLEDFLNKIKNSDEPYLSEDEVENLRKLFTSDEEDDDEDTFNPEQGKF